MGVSDTGCRDHRVPISGKALSTRMLVGETPEKSACCPNRPAGVIPHQRTLTLTDGIRPVRATPTQ